MSLRAEPDRGPGNPGSAHTGTIPRSDGSELRRIRSAGLFAALGDEEFRLVVGQSRCQGFRKGQCLFSQDAPAAAFYVVLDGWVVLSRDQSDGTRTLIKIVGPGESFAEALLAPGATYPVSAEAASEVRVVRIETERFRSLLATHPALGLSIIAATFLQLRILVEQIEHLKSWPIERRLAGILLQMCDKREGACSFDLPVEQHLIAARLAVTPPTLSRTFRKLEPLGVRARRGRVVISDLGPVIRFVHGDDVLTAETSRPARQ